MTGGEASFDSLANTWAHQSFIDRAAVPPELDPDHASNDDISQRGRYALGQVESESHPSHSSSSADKFIAALGLDMRLLGRVVA